MPQADSDVDAFRMNVWLLVLCGGTQFADALELILLPFLPRVLETQEGLNSHLHVKPGESTGWLLSFVVFIGMLVGAPCWGYLADCKGRRVGMCGSSLFVGLFGLTSSFAFSKWDLLASRFLVGVGLGGASCALALYTECLPRRRREEQLVYFFLFFSIGSLICASLAWLFLAHFESWRWLLRVCCLPGLIIGLSFSHLPESPVFLKRKGRLEEMHQVLRRYGLQNVRAVNSNEGSTSSLINDASRISTEENSVDGESSGRAYKQTVMVLCVLFLLMAIVYYALVELTVAYLAHGGSSSDLLNSWQYFEILAVNGGELPGLLAMVLLMRYKESRYAVTSLFACCGCFCFLMIFASKKAVIGTVFFFAARASALGFNQSLWVYSSVYFPSRTRAFGVGFVTMFARIGGLVSPFVGQVLFSHSQESALLFCVIACGLSSFLAFKGLSPIYVAV
mmetsp:Transcript_24316/g.39432  ORF Transcript_24316/g.39432 Transcript_24316/m.39432 type:complete len:451 (-) Transcript_24316:1277-2629(-)